MTNVLSESTAPGSGLYEAAATLPNRLGLHARSAAALVKLAVRFQSRITVVTDDRQANARSLVDLLRLGARQHTTLRVQAYGSDGEVAARAIAALIESGFGEI